MSESQPRDPDDDDDDDENRTSTARGCVAFAVGAAAAFTALIMGYVGVTQALELPEEPAAATMRLGRQLTWPALISGGLAARWFIRGQIGRARIAGAIAVVTILFVPFFVMAMRKRWLFLF